MEDQIKEKQSTEMTEDDQLQLPDVLKKLEIVPIMPSIKLFDRDLPLSLNPFFYQSKSNEKEFNEKTLFGNNNKCLCNSRRRNDIHHMILNQTTFKPKQFNIGGTKGNSNRKIILKDPVLKTVNNCIHHSHLRHKNERKLKNNGTDPDDLPECPTLDALNLEDRTSKKEIKFSDKTNQFLDFKALVEECDILFANNNSILCTGLRKNSKNFTTIQPYNIRPINSNKKLKKSQYRAATSEQTSALVSNPNTSSSCSQQARISATGGTSTCDVTIDELASYFETFVHIPKKMSSMAEMMYI